MKTAVVSNFDTRLRRIMRELGVDKLFDAVVISAEVGATSSSRAMGTLLLHCEGLLLGSCGQVCQPTAASVLAVLVVGIA